VHLVPDTDDAGGERQAMDLVRELTQRTSLRCEVVYFGAGRGHAQFEALGVPLRQVERRRMLTLDWRRARDLRRLYAGDPPALVQSWLYEGNVVALAAARAWPGTRVIATEVTGPNEIGSRIKRGIERVLLPRADRVIANSVDGGEGMVGLGVARDRLRIVDHAVAPERLRVGRSREEVRAALGVALDAPLVVGVGRPDPVKDFPNLAAAMESVVAARPDARLALVGPTDTELARLGVEPRPWLVATGWVRSIDYIAAADVVAISSWTEGHSTVADEALLLGLPVVTTRVGDHPRLVNEAGGRVVPVASPDLLAAAIAEMLGQPPDPAGVREFARKRLSWDASVHRFIQVYEELLDRSLTAPDAAITSRP
jgi:glycosyltransferase involved in cell wall biosynthesis